MAALETFVPDIGPTAEWNAAYARLEDYLRAYRVADKFQQARIIARFLQRAAEEYARDPTRSPVTLAMEEAHRALDGWFQAILQRPDLSAEQRSVAGRVALRIVDAPARFPAVFLETDQPSSELKEKLHRIMVQAGPDLEVSSMVPRPVDTPTLTELLDEAWTRLQTGYLLKALAAIALAVALLSLLLALDW